MGRKGSKSKRRNSRAPSTLIELHRLVGLYALVFLVILSSSGLLLNHSEQLGLDRRHLKADFLLDWYGIKAAVPNEAYRVLGGQVVHVEDRLYFGPDSELASGINNFKGAFPLPVPGLNWAALNSGALLFTESGERVDLLPWPLEGEAMPDLAGLDESGLPLVFFGNKTYVLNEALTRWHPAEGRKFRKVRPQVLDDEEAGRYHNAYRASVLTWERVLLDLHSGRLFTKAGIWIADTAGIALLLLAVTGIIYWGRRRWGRQP